MSHRPMVPLGEVLKHRKAFIEMSSTEEYDAAHEHRESGLERTLLLACTPRGGTL